MSRSDRRGDTTALATAVPLGLSWIVLFSRQILRPLLQAVHSAHAGAQGDLTFECIRTPRTRSASSCAPWTG